MYKKKIQTTKKQLFFCCSWPRQCADLKIVCYVIVYYNVNIDWRICKVLEVDHVFFSCFFLFLYFGSSMFHCFLVGIMCSKPVGCFLHSIWLFMNINKTYSNLTSVAKDFFYFFLNEYFKWKKLKKELIQTIQKFVLWRFYSIKKNNFF